MAAAAAAAARCGVRASAAEQAHDTTWKKAYAIACDLGMMWRLPCR